MKHQPTFIRRVCLQGMIAAFAVSLIASYPANGAERTWTNPAGGAFLDPSNWKDGDLPVSGDAIYFDAATGNPYTVQLAADFSLGTQNSAVPARRLHLLTGNQTILKLHDETNAYKLQVYGMEINKGSLTLDGGHTEVTNSILVGNQAYGEGTLKLTNQAALTTVNQTDHYRIGFTQKGTLLLDQQSSASFARRLQIGFGAGSGGSSVTLSNASSLSTTSFGIYLGSSDAAGAVATSGNSLSVLSGSSVTASTVLYIGYLKDSSNNTVVVEGSPGGAKSTLKVGTFLRIGDSESTGNLLTIKSGGELESGYLQIRSGAGNGLTVETGGKALFTDTSVNNSIRGTIAVKGGELKAGALHIYNLVTYEGGKFDLTSHLNTFEDSRFEFTLDEELTINVGGKLTVNGTTYIDIASLADGALPGTYTLFTSTTAATGMGNFVLGSTFTGFEGSLSYDANRLYLNVAAIPEPSTAWLALLAMPLLANAWRTRRSAR